jgi:hypothetical protein
MKTLSIQHSFELGWKLGRTVSRREDDLSIRELEVYAPHADLAALVQGFEDGKRRDRFRLDLGRRLRDVELGISRK